jgi:hypothetical protein
MRNGPVAATAAFALLPTAALAAADPHGAPGHQRAHKVHTPDGRHTGRHCGPGHSSDQAHGRVVTPNDMPLTARSGPSSAYRKIDKVRDGRTLGLACKKNGTKVLGDARWYKLAGHRDYVSAHYVRTFRPVPWC